MDFVQYSFSYALFCEGIHQTEICICDMCIIDLTNIFHCNYL
jgi:hypothetical protein